MKEVQVKSYFRSCLMVVTLLTVMSPPVWAAVNKCKGPGGAVVFSDLPCNEDTKGEEIRVKPASGPAGGKGSVGAPTAQQEGEAWLTPVCRQVLMRMEEVSKNPSGVGEAEKDALFGRYVKECEQRPGAAQDKARVRQQALEVQQSHACDSKRKVVAKRRAR